VASSAKCLLRIRKLGHIGELSSGVREAHIAGAHGRLPTGKPSRQEVMGVTIQAERGVEQLAVILGVGSVDKVVQPQTIELDLHVHVLGLAAHNGLLDPQACHVGRPMPANG